MPKTRPKRHEPSRLSGSERIKIEHCFGVGLNTESIDLSSGQTSHGYGMLAGPYRVLEDALEFVPKRIEGHEIFIIEFFPDESSQLIYRWNDSEGAWFAT